jgi:hypothetical protein
MMRRLALAAVALAACRAGDAAPLVTSVAFDCRPFAPAPPVAACRAAPPPGAVALWAAAAQLPAYLAAHDPPDARWRELAAAIAGAPHGAAARALPVTTRIALDNAALRIAVYAEPDHADLARAALALARAVAPTAAELRALGDEPAPDVARWIAPRSRWQLRDLRGPLAAQELPARFHEDVNQDLVAFLPILAGPRRALIAQLVAIDRDGEPHLTPVVGGLELRAGPAVDAAACVAELDLAAAACGAPAGLAAIDPARHPVTHFFTSPAHGRVGCPSCHQLASLPVVAPADAKAALRDQRTAALTVARAALDRAARGH